MLNDINEFVEDICENVWERDTSKGRWKEQDLETRDNFTNKLFGDDDSDTMKTFKIPVDFRMFGYMEIKATSFRKAIDEAYGSAKLPQKQIYMEDSLLIDKEILEEYVEDNDLIQE